MVMTIDAEQRLRCLKHEWTTTESFRFQKKKKNTSRKEGVSTPPHCRTRIKTLSFLFFHQLDFLKDKDIEKLDNIIKVVLLPEKTTAQRKARVSKYLHWVSSCNSLALVPVSDLNSSHLGFLRIVLPAFWLKYVSFYFCLHVCLSVWLEVMNY